MVKIAIDVVLLPSEEMMDKAIEINKELLKKESINIVFQNYQHPVYIQQFGEFTSHLSVIDLLFNHGEKSLDILSNKRQRNV